MKSISLLSGYIFLILATITGITSNSFLKTTEGFTKLGPTLFCIANMTVCIFCLSKAMSVIPVGFTYDPHCSSRFAGADLQFMSGPDVMYNII